MANSLTAVATYTDGSGDDGTDAPQTASANPVVADTRSTRRRCSRTRTMRRRADETAQEEASEIKLNTAAADAS